MMMKRLGVVAGALLALGLTAPQAKAVVIYDWSGLCVAGCTGQATAVLTLADSYVPGTLAMDADFISFSYSSSSGAYDIPAGPAFAGFLEPMVLPAESGQADIVLQFGDGIFDNTPGSWLSVLLSSGVEDGGVEESWTLRQPTELPAPGPLSLLALGLAGLALAGRRRSKAVA